MYDLEKYIKDTQKKIDSLVPQSFKTLQKEMNKYSEMIKSIDYSPIIDSISNVRTLFSKSYFTDLSDRISELTKPFTVFFKSLPETLIKYYNFKDWADYGWGIIDYVPKDRTYFKKVENVQEADTVMAAELSDEIIADLINDISKTDLHSDRFDEAIACFNEEKYTACILILFSIIDSFSIQLQEINEKKQRDLAKGFSKNLLQKDAINELSISVYLRVYMPLQAITVLFARGYDFKDEPDLPNRNFISHGMNQRQVTKIDCVKLLSIISNLADVKELIQIEEIVKNEK